MGYHTLSPEVEPGEQIPLAYHSHDHQEDGNEGDR